MANGSGPIPIVPALDADTFASMNSGSWSDGGWTVDSVHYKLYVTRNGCGGAKWELCSSAPSGIPAAEMTESHWDLISGGSHSGLCCVVKDSVDYEVQLRDGDAYVAEIV